MSKPSSLVHMNGPRGAAFYTALEAVSMGTTRREKTRLLYDFDLEAKWTRLVEVLDGVRPDPLAKERRWVAAQLFATGSLFVRDVVSGDGGIVRKLEPDEIESLMPCVVELIPWTDVDRVEVLSRMPGTY